MRDGERRGTVLPGGAVRGWLDALVRERRLVGPALPRRGQTIFRVIEDAAGLDLDYCSTMMGPQIFVYPTIQPVLRMDPRTGGAAEVAPGDERRTVLFAVHPCDMQAITVVDQSFLGKTFDASYAKRRAEIVTAVLNCGAACDQGFCESMETGPFLRLTEGFDLEMTRLADRLLVETRTGRGAEILALSEGGREAGAADFEEKEAREAAARASFKKKLDISGLPELLMRNWDHPVYPETADARCLSCTNCTKVCPTCYCYDMADDMDFAMTEVVRRRSKDSCHELHFAAVHGGNFREVRAARLRQFVTHKLSTWLEQYGCFGCVGCGRCMTWCPTGIDLSEMAKRVQEDFARGRAR